ncbi:MAG TPA: substrate-binding domain-containing protein [Candidatus Dormibacteraeota bacterium]|jgi:D-xylose transport system substrate-binding protein|nr:substrate-binding domain-containing protein [Candidatus Dormibacteraeota bacterium]
MFPSPRVRLCCALLLVCGPSLFVSTASAQTSSSKLQIGFLVDSFKIERWQTDYNSFEKRAKELGAEVILQDADGNDDLQLKQAKKLLDSHVKALVLIPHDTDKAVRIVELAKSKGVPVVSYDRLIRNSDIDFYVGADVVAIGTLQANSLTSVASKGNYILLEGSPSDVNAHLLLEGQKKALQPFVDRGDIKIVAELWCPDWNPLEAYTRISDALAKNHNQIAAIVASNDGTAGGAIQALEEVKLDGKVAVSGQDADLAAIIRVLKGTQSMTIYKPITSLAAQAADAAVTLAKGQQPSASGSIANGKKDVPAIFGPVVAVNKANVKETVIKDGFQNLGTIQKSLPPDKWPK